MALKLGELLQKENLVTREQLDTALAHQKSNGGKLGRALVSLGYVKDEEITSLLSRQYGVPSINLDHFEVDPVVIKTVPAELARKYVVLPLARSGATLTIAMADPTNVFAMDEIRFMTGYNVEPVVASETSLEEAIDKYYGSSRSLELRRDGSVGPTSTVSSSPRVDQKSEGPTLTGADLEGVGLQITEEDFDALGGADDVETLKTEEDEIDLSSLARSSEAGPVIKVANYILVESLKQGASDIHIEPYERRFRVRFRVDGVMREFMALPMKMRDALTSRIKIMSKLDIAEKRLPQDGRIKIRMRVDDKSRELDFRVSVLPTLWGEKIVMRLLDKTKLMLDMTKLGFETESLERLQRAISKPYGIVLVTGPTGSGKTNTLYSALTSLNKIDTNIMTAEDPVEFNLEGINQVQVREAIGLTFAQALRSFLRQDPNIILVGEIRDYETAEIAVKASLTGHLVLSTLHTNDAPSTVSRLVNMGIEPFLVGTAVNLIQAQRLVRRICTKCKVEEDVPANVLTEVGFTPEQIGSFKVMKGKGCGGCNNMGYKGRVGLYEVMEMSEGLRDLVLVGATAVELRRKALEEGMLTLRMSGLEKVKAGVTTIEEVLRETVL